MLRLEVVGGSGEVVVRTRRGRRVPSSWIASMMFEGIGHGKTAFLLRYWFQVQREADV
jgi:hypothetical protein